MAVPFQDGLSQFFDDSGNPLSGGLVYTYRAGTTTPVATYTNRSSAVEHSNPVVLDAAGRVSIWLDNSTAYRFDVKKSDGTLLDSVDNIILSDGSGPGYQVETFIATDGQTLIELAGTYTQGINAISVYVGDGGSLYLAPGTDYAETSESSITLTHPLEGGELVTVILGNRVSFSAGTVADAAEVSYTPLVGSSTTVNSWLDRALYVADAGGGTSAFEAASGALSNPSAKLVQSRDFGHRTVAIAAANSPYTMDGLPEVLLINATAGNVTVTLPAANFFGTGYASRVLIRRTDSSTNTVTISRAGTNTVDGVTSITLEPQASKTLISNGSTAWYTAGGDTSITNTSSSTILAGRDYISRGYRDTVVVNGAEVSISPARTSHHDMLRAWPSLVDPLTGSSNFAVLNVSQALVAIPGAVSAPYWTDPGPLVYNTAGSGAGYIPASIPGQIDFVTHSGGDRCIQFTTPVGFGNGEAGKRRIQLNSYQITTRIPVAWDLSFLIPDADNAPYDSATGYDYPVLIWQLKDATSQPVWSVGYETTADPDVFDLYVNFLYSDYDLDASTYRRQYNAVSGTVGNSKSAIRVALTQINRNEWNDLWIEMFLDERDHTDAAGGLGYATMRLNGESILEWSGPTYMITNISGGAPVAHRWSLGLYRFEYSIGTTPQGVPAGLEELDLDRAVDPAPYVRQMLFRRGRLLKL